MTRINTNVSSLIAQKTLASSHNTLQESLTRLSTGLRINAGKDDPAGLIASEILRSDIVSVSRAVTNSERANQLIATADSALGQVSSLLNDIRGLVSEAANTGALSDDQIAANQLQVDSSLEAIDRISQTTAFQGRRLLDGSLDFLTTSAGTSALKAVGTFGATLDANASGSIGAAGTNATIVLSGSTGGVTFTALSAGTNLNGFNISFVESSNTATSAAFDGAAKTLVITGSAGATAANVVSAVAANASAAAAFAATASTAGALTATTGSTTSAVTAGGAFDNTLILSATSAGTALNNTNLTFVSGATFGAAYSTATNTLTITQSATQATTAQVISAINATGVFSASTIGTGLGVYSNGTTSAVTSGGASNNVIVLSAVTGGAAFNGLTITTTDTTATGAETASYSTGSNTLTIGKNTNSSTAQLVAAINASGVFSASTSGAGLGVYSAGTTANVTTGGGAGSASISDLHIQQANFGTANSIAVNVNVDQQATKGSLTYSGGTLASDLVLEVGGKSGFNVFNFGSGSTVSTIAAAINLVSDATGVTATAQGNGLQLDSVEYGSDAFVSAKALTGSFATLAGGLSATRDSGSDVQVRVNGVTATGKGLKASLNTSTLDIDFSINSNFSSGDSFSFNITGGGAIFQLGPDVVSNQQARLGIQGVSSATLGGVSGTLFQLRSGGSKSLATDVKGAAKVVDEVITSVTGLRGRLGAFQKTTLETNINSLNDTLSTLTDAESSIRDADFAAESAKLTRAQILVQSGTSVLAIANQNPQSVLSLLR